MWAWDDIQERVRVESAYIRMIHQQFIDDNPDFLPVCQCHQMTREARLELNEPKEK